DYAEAYYTLGTVRKQQKELEPAAAALRRAIELQPDFAGAHSTLASVLREQGDVEGAKQEVARTAELSKRATDAQAALFALNSGKRFLNAGDIDAAIERFQAAVKLAPNSAVVHSTLATALDRKGDSAGAARERALAQQFTARR
ncbi:MAG TPA: tetratricopeptide repeat protein, partial [Terriglobales bacterium]|nr:tetratricopeptide repeat protein [Terriglobales bacterium]